ncbi:MAG: large subunit ribosomal protein L21 [Planctomycetota bacterium]|jgi:large subunit ribosomal protein L21
MGVKFVPADAENVKASTILPDRAFARGTCLARLFAPIALAASCGRGNYGRTTLYAIINDSGQQTTVRQGEIILLDLKKDTSPGDQLTFDEVFLIGNEGTVSVGKPTVAGASVVAEVLGMEKGEKIISLRFKRRKNVRVKRGHRQRYTRVRITSINA